MSRSRDFSTEPDVATLVKHMNPLVHPGAQGVQGSAASLIPSVELVQLQLVVERVAGQDVTRPAQIFEGDVCRIGSHESNDLVLDDKTISRFHCRVTRHGDTWRLTDTGSRNGTQLDDVKVIAAELGTEGTLVIGDSRVRLRTSSRGHVTPLPAPPSFGALVGRGPAMQKLFAMLERIAASDIDVLVHGESGTGKELVATELVQRSPRADGPVIVVDCGSISPALVESELFGHVRGAFTGADRDREGAFEAADGGTVFLDEIGELPVELQPKLLRALEAREVRRVGQTKMRRVDVRVIAATNRDLEREVNRGRFREDLYYRLAKVSLHVPPLRERIEDIPLLVTNFLAYLTDTGRAPNSAPGSRPARDTSTLFSQAVLEEMQQHDWPGNVRELKNYVERSLVLDNAPPPPRRSGLMRAFSGSVPPATGPGAPTAEGEDAAARPPPSESPAGDLPFRVAKEAAVAAFERAYLGPLLERCNGNVSQAAREARMDRMYLHQLAQKYGLRVARKGP